jgi:predicted Rossmann fold nucleotide-binding protein DprA/Smf involved in DNA uptake
MRGRNCKGAVLEAVHRTCRVDSIEQQLAERLRQLPRPAADATSSTSADVLAALGEEPKSIAQIANRLGQPIDFVTIERELRSLVATGQVRATRSERGGVCYARVS